jgi:hypothetical protein
MTRAKGTAGYRLDSSPNLTFNARIVWIIDLYGLVCTFRCLYPSLNSGLLSKNDDLFSRTSKPGRCEVSAMGLGSLHMITKDSIGKPNSHVRWLFSKEYTPTMDEAVPFSGHRVAKILNLPLVFKRVEPVQCNSDASKEWYSATPDIDQTEMYLCLMNNCLWPVKHRGKLSYQICFEVVSMTQKGTWEIGN